MDWKEFDTHIISKGITRSYSASLRMLINFIKKLFTDFKDKNDDEILDFYRQNPKQVDEKILIDLKSRGKGDTSIGMFHSAISRLNEFQGKDNNYDINENLNFLITKSHFFRDLREHPEGILTELNSLDKEVIKGQILEYEESKGIEKIRKIRYLILKELEKGKISEGKIEEIKKNVNEEHSKNILQNWKNFGIAHSILYWEFKERVDLFLDWFAKRIIKDLKLESVKVRISGFEGPQNQGNSQIWFAIYNKSYSSQRNAKQIYFSVGGGFNPEEIAYGLEYFIDETKNKIESKDLEAFDYTQMLDYLKQFKKMIEEDIASNDEDIQIEVDKIALDLIEKKKQIILFGPPGTGKTFSTKNLAVAIIKNE